MKERVIMHYDMDSFYASCEIMNNPKLKGKPLVVGEGVVTTASYEARKFGVKSAMSVWEARKLCPDLVVVPVNKDLYFEISDRIQNLVKKLSEKVEFIASDEGYVDVTSLVSRYQSKQDFAKIFQKRIFKLIGLTCSVGIGYNKLTAKIASDINKPNGIYVFDEPSQFVEYIKDKNIGIIPGVGKKLTEELERDKIKKVDDIYKFSHYELGKKYGVGRGSMLYYYSRGLDDSEVESARKSHSIGNENTYRQSLNGEEEVRKELDLIFDRVYARLLEEGFFCKTLTVKIKYSSFVSITRSFTLDSPSSNRLVLYDAFETIFLELENFDDIRLVGISLGNLSKSYYEQLKFKP